MFSHPSSQAWVLAKFLIVCSPMPCIHDMRLVEREDEYHSPFLYVLFPETIMACPDLRLWRHLQDGCIWASFVSCASSLLSRTQQDIPLLHRVSHHRFPLTLHGQCMRARRIQIMRTIYMHPHLRSAPALYQSTSWNLTLSRLLHFCELPERSLKSDDGKGWWSLWSWDWSDIEPGLRCRWNL